MSVWAAVDGVSDHSLPNWSSLDEIEWIDSEAKEDHNMQEAVMQMRPSGKADGDDSEHMIVKSWSQNLTNTQRSEYSSTKFNTMEDGDNSCSKNAISTTGFLANDAMHKPQLNVSNRSDIFGTGGSGEGPQYTSPGYDFEGDMELCKEGRSYQDAAADVANSTCQFLLSDMYSQGGTLEFLEQDNEQGRRDNLLEYGWGNTNNLEDMENMFLNNDSMLSGGFEDDSDGMLWEPPTPSGPGSMYRSVKETASPILIQKDESETKVEFLPCESVLGCAKEEAGAEPVEQCVFGYSQLQLSSDAQSADLPINHGMKIDYGKGQAWEVQEGIEGPSRCSRGIEEKEADQEVKVKQTLALPTEDGGHLIKEGGKAIKTRKHSRRAKRLEENLKMQVSGKKLAVTASSHATKSPHPYVPTPQDVPLSSTSISQHVQHMQPESVQHMQPVPYIHAGYGFHAHHHHMHVMGPHVTPSIPPPPSPPPLPPPPPQQQPTQSVFLGYQAPYNTDPGAKISRGKTSFEVPSKSLNVGTTMTPQEKIEKLRWRQKMQARLAVEQQQQKLLNQPLVTSQAVLSNQEKLQKAQDSSKKVKECVTGSVRPEPPQGAEPLVWNTRNTSPVAGMVLAEDNDESFAASVLQQMLDIASKMDVRTRLCLRDGFRRLAGNALHRHTANDCGGSKGKINEPNNWSESSSSNDKACCQRTLTVEDIVETQTNPVDRFIAHLLFNKRCPSFPPDYMNSTPSGNNVSESSQADLLGQDGWTSLSESMPSSEVSPSPRNSSIRDGLGGSHVPHKIKQVDHTSASHSSVVSCVQQVSCGQQQEGSPNRRSNVAESAMMNNTLDSSLGNMTT